MTARTLSATIQPVSPSGSAFEPWIVVCRCGYRAECLTLWAAQRAAWAHDEDAHWTTNDPGVTLPSEAHDGTG